MTAPTPPPPRDGLDAPRPDVGAHRTALAAVHSGDYADSCHPPIADNGRLARERESTVVHSVSPPNRIDVMTDLSGIDSFGSAWARRIEGRVRGQSFQVLGRADLIANKRAAGRPKDLVDVAALEAGD